MRESNGIRETTILQNCNTADFRMVVQKVNGKWRDIIANGSTVQ